MVFDLNFSAVVTIPVAARPSYFDEGHFDCWTKPLDKVTSVDLTLDFTADYVSIDEGDNADTIIEKIEDADWFSDYSDDYLANCLQHLCAVNVPDDLGDIDDNGTGCDGVVLLELGEEDNVPHSMPIWMHSIPEELDGKIDTSDLDAIADEVIQRVAFDPKGYLGTFFYVIDEEAIHQGSPFDKNNWNDKKDWQTA